MGEVTGHGHYKATCNFCKRVWNRGKPKRMAAHLSNNCLQVPHDIRNTILNAFLKEYGSSPLDERFRNHCIKVFNERFSEFMNDTYLLAYYLHPKYKGIGINKQYFPKILMHAGSIWKDLGHNQDSCKDLYAQLQEEDDENNDLILELLPENNDDSEPRDDIELELERILSLNEVFVVINNNDYVTANQEENTNSEATEEIEDYDPAQLASNYLSDLE
ncbi:6152_t:CDS:2 [Entrophospora sp. SA101]|nr:6152_t:CDS:2 [Entrophospora sp. SA101]